MTTSVLSAVRRCAVMLLAIAAAATGVLALASVRATSARADTAPATGSGLPTTVSADALPTVQINGIVWSQVTVGNTVYATGSFSYARPAGSAPGHNQVARASILAYDLVTGKLITSFNHRLNGTGRTIVASANHSRIYVGGDFTTVDGVAHAHIAAFSTATGALISTFRGGTNGEVDALAASNTTLYAGGSFSKANNVARTRLAGFSAASGGLTKWAPKAVDGTVTAMVIAPGGTTLVTAGRFTRLNTSSRYGIGGLSIATGAVTSWNARFPVRDAGLHSSFTNLVTDGRQIYASAYTYGGGRNTFEGTMALTGTGGVVWMNSCHGDTYSVYPIGSVLYSVSHAHDCSDVGDWEDTAPRSWYRAAASTTNPGAGCHLNPNNNPRYYSFTGVACATRLDWYPQLTPGKVSGADQAAWSVTGNVSYVSLGGEFPSVNGLAQQGLVRFAVRTIAPNKSGPIPSSATLPVATSPQLGQARVQWNTTWDRDNENLRYDLYRDGGTTPIYTTTVASTFWNLPVLSFVDTGVEAGSTHSYRVTVTDPFDNTFVTGKGPAVTILSAAVAPDPYGTAVLASNPSLYYRMDESTGTAAVDATGAGRTGLYSGAVTHSTPSPVTGSAGTATTFDGKSSTLSTAAIVASPETFSTELWFSTTTTHGGKLIGYENARGGLGKRYDRQVYLNANGTLSFTTTGVVRNVITSARAYNNGTWHQVIATHSVAGMKLYVDGVLVGANANSAGGNYGGYWRIGGGATGISTSTFFKGSIDEVAVYPAVLSAATVSAHYQASPLVHQTPNVAPTASFTSTASGVALSVDGSASTDSDGVVAGYSWDFGDGATATGATTTHSYAGAGTYTVTLTVTDNAGGVGTSTATVTVNTAVLLAQDDFGRSVTGGWGTADSGGAWSTSPSSAFSVSPGTVTASPGQGNITGLTASQSAGAVLTAVSSTDTDTRVTVSLAQAPAAGPTTFWVVGRKITGVGSYRVKVRILADGEVELTPTATDASGVETTLPGATPTLVPGLIYNTGDLLHLRLRVTGTGTTTVQARAWSDPAGSGSGSGTPSAEPATWLVTATDSTAALQSPGSVALNVYVSSSATAPVTIAVTGLKVWDATTV